MPFRKPKSFYSSLSPINKRLLIFTCSAIAIVALYLGYVFTLNSTLESRFDKIRKAGYPTNPEELNNFYTKIPDYENSALIYEEAYVNFVTSPPDIDNNMLIVCGYAQMPPDTEPLDQEKKVMAARYLSDNSKSLDLLHEAAKSPKARYNVDFTNLLIKHLSNTRQAARLFEMKGIVALENSDSAEFVESIKDSVALSCSLDNEPTIISTLVQIATQAISLDSLQRALTRNEFTDDQLRQLYDAFGKYEEYRGLQRGFIGERCFIKNFGLYEFCNTSELPLYKIFLEHASIIFYKVSGMQKINQAGYLNLLNEIIDMSTPPPDEMLKKSKEIQKKLNSFPKYMSTCRDSAGGIIRVFDKKCLALANTACNRAALAVERYRLKYGKLPDKLSDLKGEFVEKTPLDPFDGKELRYKKLDKGYMIYSVGSDCVDNGGTPEGIKRIGYRPDTDTTVAVYK